MSDPTGLFVTSSGDLVAVVYNAYSGQATTNSAETFRASAVVSIAVENYADSLVVQMADGRAFRLAPFSGVPGALWLESLNGVETSTYTGTNAEKVAALYAALVALM